MGTQWETIKGNAVGRAVRAIRAIVGDESEGLWHSIGQLTSRADEWLTK